MKWTKRKFGILPALISDNRIFAIVKQAKGVMLTMRTGGGYECVGGYPHKLAAKQAAETILEAVGTARCDWIGSTTN
jgi:hypothetical protein